MPEVVTPGWSRTAIEVIEGVNLSGRQIVLTGGSSGIGLESVRAFVTAGADVVIGVRDLAKGLSAMATFPASMPGSVRVELLELCDPGSVVAFAATIAGPVDILVTNAGVSKTPKTHLPNGLDVRFATNHLGHFLLAHRLKAQMAQRGARIVVVSSAAHKNMPVRLDDLQWQSREHQFGMAYGESKSANILFAQEATRRWASEHIYANAVLPGSALTGLQRYHGDALKKQIGFIDAEGNATEMVKSTEQAAATSVWAAVAPELEGRGGLVLEDCALALPVGPHTHAWMGYDTSVSEPSLAAALWDHSLELLDGLI